MADAAPQASIVIPTYKRPDRLTAAAASAIAQSVDEGFAFEVVVVDNDAAGSARETVEALSARSSVPLRYVLEPQSGVAHARNAGLRATTTPLIAFLDDDETATPHWLSELVRVQAETQADAVFGPVRTELPFDPPAHRAHFEAFFARLPDHAEGVIDGYYGCGCSLLRRASLETPEPFSPVRNETGGEDDLLFQQMAAAGKRFAWAPGALVNETPIASRVSLDYTLRRGFAYGQGPSAKCAAETPPNIPGVAFWMAVGVAQFSLYGLIALGAWAARRPLRAHWYDRTARGLGKLLWWGPFKINFYHDAPKAASTEG